MPRKKPLTSSSTFCWLLLCLVVVVVDAQVASRPKTCVTKQLRQYQEYICVEECSVPQKIQKFLLRVGIIKTDAAPLGDDNNGTTPSSKCPQKCQYVDKFEQECCDGYDRKSDVRDSPCLGNCYNYLRIFPHFKEISLKFDENYAYAN